MQPSLCKFSTYENDHVLFVVYLYFVAFRSQTIFKLFKGIERALTKNLQGVLTESHRSSKECIVYGFVQCIIKTLL